MTRRILIIIMLLCAVGIYVFSVRSNNEYAKDACRLDSLPTLTTTEQILEAVNSPSEKRYVICDYKFPKVESVADPYDNLSSDSGYVYIYVNVYGTRRREHELYDLHKSLRGRLFFDENTELLGFDKVFVAEAPSHHRVNFSGSRKRYEYNYLPSDAKLSFIAILGNNKAQFTGLDSSDVVYNIEGTPTILGNIVEGDKAQLADWSSDGGGLYSFAAFLCGVVFVCLGLFLLVDYIKSKKSEKK